MKFHLDNLVADYERIEQELANESVYSNPKRLKECMLQKKSLELSVKLYLEYKKMYEDFNEAKRIISVESDPDLIAMAKEEIPTLEQKIVDIEEKIKIALLPKDRNDDKNTILEIRSGAGGDEASLFAAELTEAYMIFARSEWFQVELLDESMSDTGGYKEVILKITGQGAYSKFKFEGGTHRVQRIPVTEKQGRVHTSTITVAVLPEAEDIDIVLRDEDLDIMACRASGAGWQHVNKTNSAIRIVHKPTGIVVECQDQRSQLKNKEKAMNILRSRVYALEEEKRHKEEGENRLAQVGTWDRSEKIRTYNFPQDRVTDHRIGMNFSNIPGIMQGKIGAIIDAVAVADQTAKLEHMNT